MVSAVKNAKRLGLNINPKLTINIINPRMTFKSPLVVLYSTSDIPFASKKIESRRTDNPRISAAAITPKSGKAIMIIPRIIAIMLIIVFLYKCFSSFNLRIFFRYYNFNFLLIF